MKTDDRARAMVYPLARETRRLDRLISKRYFTPGRDAGRLCVEAIHALERAERTARTLYAFDPTGL